MRKRACDGRNLGAPWPRGGGLLTWGSRWKITTRPPLSPVASRSPVLLNSTHDMMSAETSKGPISGGSDGVRDSPSVTSSSRVPLTCEKHHCSSPLPADRGTKRLASARRLGGRFRSTHPPSRPISLVRGCCGRASNCPTACPASTGRRDTDDPGSKTSLQNDPLRLQTMATAPAAHRWQHHCLCDVTSPAPRPTAHNRAEIRANQKGAIAQRVA